MSDRRLKILFGLLSFLLFIALILKLVGLPNGMILPGYLLGGMVLFGVILACIVTGFILKIIFKTNSYFALFFISTTIAFSIFYYYLYSPILQITVPTGYVGPVNLVLSNAKENILELDTNGIGYLTRWTFNHVYSNPEVKYKNGTNINDLCVGFAPHNFWARGKTCCIAGKQFESLDFEITSKDKKGVKQYNSKNVSTLVNKKLILFEK